MVIEPESMTEVKFIPTGAGAHGMAIARAVRSLQKWSGVPPSQSANAVGA